MHAEVLHTMCIGIEEELVQFEILATSGLDVHASSGNQRKEYFSYFGKPCSGGGIEESLAGLEYFPAKSVCYARIKTRNRILFLFLPIKKICVRNHIIWDLLSLKDVGWGPPRIESYY